MEEQYDLNGYLYD